MHLLYKWISVEIYKWYQLHRLIYLFDVMLQTVSTIMLKDEAACIQLMWAREAGRRSCWNVYITQDAYIPLEGIINYDWSEPHTSNLNSVYFYHTYVFNMSV